MTQKIYQLDCQIKPGAETFAEGIAGCYYTGGELLQSDNRALVLFDTDVSPSAEQMIRDYGGDVVDVYESPDRTAVVGEWIQDDAERKAEAIVTDVGFASEYETNPAPDNPGQDTIFGHENICNKLAQDCETEWVGSGVARATFTAVPDPDFPGSRDPKLLPFEACVLKVARYARSGKVDGVAQNREELNNYNDLPDEIKGDVGGKGPIFNPITDQDGQRDRYLTQPYCPPPGNPQNVMQRLQRMGYDVRDIAGRSDNVGTYPDTGGTAIIDYGFTIKNTGETIHKKMQKLEARLQKTLIDDIESEDLNPKAEVRFRVTGPGVDPQDKMSSVEMSAKGKVQSGIVRLPEWHLNTVSMQEYESKLLRVTSEVESKHRDTAEMNPRVNEIANDHVQGAIELKVSAFRNADPFDVGTQIVEIVDAYHGEFQEFDPGDITETTSEPETLGVDGVQEMDDFIDHEIQWLQALEDIGMKNVDFMVSGGVDMSFQSPKDARPTLASQDSNVWWVTPASVKTVSYAVADGLFSDTFQRDKYRTDVMKPVASEVAGADRHSGLTISPEMSLVSDAGTAGIAVALQYAIRHRGDFLDPHEVILALADLTEVHNERTKEWQEEVHSKP